MPVPAVGGSVVATEPDAGHLREAERRAHQVPELLLRRDDARCHVEVVAEVEQGRQAQQGDQPREAGRMTAVRRRSRGGVRATSQSATSSTGPSQTATATPIAATPAAAATASGITCWPAGEGGEQRHEPERDQLLDAALHGEGVDERRLSGERRHGRPAPARLDYPVQEADQAERKRGRDEGQIGLKTHATSAKPSGRTAASPACAPSG